MLLLLLLLPGARGAAGPAAAQAQLSTDCDLVHGPASRASCPARMVCRVAATAPGTALHAISGGAAVRALPPYAITPSAALAAARRAEAEAAAEAERRVKSAGTLAAVQFIRAREDATAAVKAALAAPPPRPRPTLPLGLRGFSLGGDSGGGAAVVSAARAALRRFRGGTAGMYAGLLAAHRIATCAGGSRTDAQRSRWVGADAADVSWGADNETLVPRPCKQLADTPPAQCERLANCAWREVPPPEAEPSPTYHRRRRGSRGLVRQRQYEAADVARAQDDIAAHTATLVAITVGPALALAAAACLGCVSWFRSRCLRNRCCGGRVPRGEGYSPRERMLPAVGLAAAGLATLALGALLLLRALGAARDQAALWAALDAGAARLAAYGGELDAALNGTEGALGALTAAVHGRLHAIPRFGLTLSQTGAAGAVHSALFGWAAERETALLRLAAFGRAYGDPEPSPSSLNGSLVGNDACLAATGNPYERAHASAAAAAAAAAPPPFWDGCGFQYTGSHANPILCPRNGTTPNIVRGRYTQGGSTALGGSFVPRLGVHYNCWSTIDRCPAAGRAVLASMAYARSVCGLAGRGAALAWLERRATTHSPVGPLARDWYFLVYFYLLARSLTHSLARSSSTPHCPLATPLLVANE